MGQASILLGIGILLISVFLGETIGAGTICNILGMGILIDTIMALGLIPKAPNYAIGLGMLLLSVLIMAVGCYFYISSGMGCGPRDAMMSALAKRFPKVSVGIIRSSIEIVAILCGWLLGGQAGLGTLIAMFATGVAIQYVFKFFHFNIKAIEHESCLYTLRSIFHRLPVESVHVPGTEVHEG